MENPGLAVFAATMTQERPSTHPFWGDVNDDVDPDRHLDEEEGSDFVRNVGFGRWRNPGQSLRVPLRQGPPFAPGETPEDVVHGEVISPDEQDGADKILNGEHESNHPSENPHVEHARQELHTPESATAVHALSGLLSGDHPSSVSSDVMDAAHEYLSKHFTGVRVNPHHGTLTAVSPAGSQLVRRRTHLPAVPDHPSEPSYSLTNKHGTFESKNPQRLVRAMLAFQILHNELAMQQQQKKKDDEDDGLSSTSGFRDWMGLDSPAPSGPISWKDALLRRTKPSPEPRTPSSGAVFEPGHGTEKNDHGVRGGWVAHDSDAPSEWRRDENGIAYSPGHSMNEMLDPIKATAPRADPYFPGHTYTYMKSSGTGHTIERRGQGITYFVRNIHPTARGRGFDLPPVPRSSKPVLVPEPPKASTPPPRKRAPRKKAPAAPSELPPTTSAVKANDLCPVCVSGYLEPYDRDTHECLNCGSLVKQAGLDKEAARRYEDEPTDQEIDDMFAENDRLNDKYDQHLREHGVAHDDDWRGMPAGESRSVQYRRTPDGGLVEHHWEDDLLFPHEGTRKPPRGLGRGLKDIQPYEGDPLNLSSGGSENPDNAVVEEDYAHPLADEEINPEYVGYEAPKRILDRTSALYDIYHDSETGLKHFRDSDFRPPSPTGSRVFSDQPMFALKRVHDEEPAEGEEPNWDAPYLHEPGNTCETCYLKYGDLHTEHEDHDDRAEGHEFKPFQADVGARFSATEVDPIDEHMGKLGYQPAHKKPGDTRIYIARLPGAPHTYAKLTEGVGGSGWVLTADHVPPKEVWTQGEDDQPFKGRHMQLDRLTKEPAPKFRQPLPDLGERTMASKSIMATGHHPIDDDNLNRAIRDLAEHGRNSHTYQKVFDTAYEPPAIPRTTDTEGTQRQKRVLSSVNPGLSRFADWDTTQVNHEACTHCSGSGVDPEYGDQCSHCEGSGNEPE